MRNKGKAKTKFIVFFILMICSLFILVPNRVIKASEMGITLTPNPIDFGQYVTLKWTCPSGNCEAKSKPSYSEWSGNITEKSGTKSFKIDKFDKLTSLGTVGVVFSLKNNAGPGAASGFPLKINKNSLIFLIAIDNSDTTNQSTDTLNISKDAAKTRGIELQYAYAPGTWTKLSHPPNSRWKGNFQNDSDKIKLGLTNINPLPTSTTFCLGDYSYSLGTCVDVNIIGSTPTPGSLEAHINAHPKMVQPNGSTTITWTSKNAHTCSITETPAGGTPSVISTDANGTEEIDNISTTTDFKIKCKKGPKSASDNVTVTILSSLPHPGSTITLYADPTEIEAGSSTVLYWNLGNNDVNFCFPTASPDNTQWDSILFSSFATSKGSTTISNLHQTTDFYITCTTSTGPVIASASTTVTVTVTKKQKKALMELIDDYFTRDIMSTQICNHINKDPGIHQWSCDKDQKQFCADFPEYILKNLHTFAPKSIKKLKLNDGCFNKIVNTKKFLSILTGEILSTNWLQGILDFFKVAHPTYSKYISNIDYILRKAEVNRCLFDQCCIYSGKAENLNEVMEGTEEPKYPMTFQEVKDEGAFLTKREQEDARNLLDFFCCR